MRSADPGHGPLRHHMQKTIHSRLGQCGTKALVVAGIHEGGLDAADAVLAAAVPFQINTASAAHLGEEVAPVQDQSQHLGKTPRVAARYGGSTLGICSQTAQLVSRVGDGDDGPGQGRPFISFRWNRRECRPTSVASAAASTSP